MLATTDTNPPHIHPLPSGIKYPSRRQLTTHWLVPPDAISLTMYPDNNDAMFMLGTQKQKPSHLLLHHTYGAAVVKYWGKSKFTFTDHTNIPHPIMPVEAPSSLPKVSSKANVQDSASGGSVDFVEGEMYDNNDIMLFFWGSSKAATERHWKKVEAHVQHLQNWQNSISAV